MDDLISRNAAIDAVENIDCSDGVGISALKCEAVDDVVTAIKALPSAQPEIEERKEESAQNVPKEDLISRKAAIDSLDSFILDETTNLQGDSVREILESLPSAEPEIIRCKDCKWWAVIPNDDSELSDYRACYALKHCRTKAIDFCSRAERRADDL